MSYEQKSCDSFRLYDFYVPFYQMKINTFFPGYTYSERRRAPALNGRGVSAQLSQLYHHIFRATGEYIRLHVIALLDFPPLSSRLKITESSVVWE